MKAKRFLTGLLTAAMVLSSLPMTAFAEETPGIEAMAEESGWTADTSWYDADETVFTLTTAAELAGLAELVNGGNSFNGKTIYLGANIDLEDQEWTPIGTNSNKFQGTFDGQENTISNLKITRGLENAAGNNRIGFFGAGTSAATLQNFTLENVDVTGSVNVAAVLGGAGGAEARITNVHVTGDVEVLGYWYTGAILGNGYSKVTDCSVIGKGADESYVSITGGYVGGIVGYMGEGNCTTTGCTVKDITVSGAYNGIGGVNGILHYGNTISNCTVKDVEVWQTTEPEAEDRDRIYCGAFAGTYLDNGGKNPPTLSGCSFEGELYYGEDKNDALEATRYVGSLWYGAEPPATVNISNCTIKMPPVAEIDGKEYETLAEAVGAAEAGDTIKLMANTMLSEKITIENDDEITLDLNGFTISYTSNVKSTDAAIKNFGNLTIKDSEGEGKITYKSSAPSTANTYGTHTISNEGGTLTLVDGIIENTTTAGASYAIDNNSTLGETILNVKGGEIVAEKVAIRQFVNHATEVNKVSISDGEITGNRAIWIQLPDSDKTKSPMVDVDITGGTLTATGESGGYQMAIYSYSHGNSYDNVDINIEDGTFDGDIAVGGGSSNGGEGAEKVRISGGKFVDVYSYMDKADIEISGGYFVEKPAAEYLEEGLTFVSSDVKGYPYTVGEKKAEAQPAETAPSVPAVDTDSIPKDVEDDVAKDVIGALAPKEEDAVKPSISENVMDSKAEDIATNNTVSKEDGAAKLEAAGVSVPEVEEGEEPAVNIVVQPYMDIKIDDVKTETTEDDATTITELTLNITPMYQKVATTVTDVEEDAIVTEGEGKNAVVLERDELNLDNTEVTVTIPLPETFVTTEDAPLYVKHTKGGVTYMYEGTVEDGVLTFVNPHGFSLFTITSNTPGASIDGTHYETLEDALKAADKGDTIVIEDAEAGLTVTLKKDIDVTLKNNTDGEITVTINGKEIKIEAGEEEPFEYDYKKPSSNSSSKPKYDITVEDSDNGEVKSSTSRSRANREITITVTPDKGYELDELTIETEKGKEIDFEKGSKAGTFVFDMPRADVVVEASFEKADDAEETPEEDEDVSDTEKALVMTIGSPIMNVDGEYIVNDVAPVIKGERTMLPIRAVANYLGADVEWNEAEQKVIITKDDMVIEIFIGQPFATVNGTPVQLDAPAFIENGRTYLPLRFVAENLGATVTWDGTANTVTIVPGK